MKITLNNKFIIEINLNLKWKKNKLFIFYDSFKINKNIL